MFGRIKAIEFVFVDRLENAHAKQVSVTIKTNQWKLDAILSISADYKRSQISLHLYLSLSLQPFSSRSLFDNLLTSIITSFWNNFLSFSIVDHSFKSFLKQIIPNGKLTFKPIFVLFQHIYFLSILILFFFFV